MSLPASSDDDSSSSSSAEENSLRELYATIEEFRNVFLHDHEGLRECDDATEDSENDVHSLSGDSEGEPRANRDEDNGDSTNRDNSNNANNNETDNYGKIIVADDTGNLLVINCEGEDEDDEEENYEADDDEDYEDDYNDGDDEDDEDVYEDHEEYFYGEERNDCDCRRCYRNRD